MSPTIATPLLLIASNVLMIFAWYGHLKHPHWPLWFAVLTAWGIAFFEYCLAVPANRLGYESGTLTAAQLKVMQEAITMGVFAVFGVLYLGEELRRNYAAATLCLVAAVGFIFLPAK